VSAGRWPGDAVLQPAALGEPALELQPPQVWLALILDEHL
jgi:hypothetical protein